MLPTTATRRLTDLVKLTPEDIPDDWYTRIFDERYLQVDQRRNTLQRTLEEVAWIERETGLTRPSRILDLCCGYGRHAIQLARRGHEVIGIDLSATLLNKAELDAAGAGVKLDLRCQDIRERPAEEFDLIICMHTSLGYFAAPREAVDVVSALQNCLRPQGRMIIQQIQFGRSVRTDVSEGQVLPDGCHFQKVASYNTKRRIWHGHYCYSITSRVSLALPFRIFLVDWKVACPNVINWPIRAERTS